nr:reverse transcriptase [Tanacetum cinerariifolium]
MSVNMVKPPLLPKPTCPSKPLAIKWISPAERQERLSKGLYFNCDNRWEQGHKCPGKIGKGDVHVLIDNGSTCNFIRPGDDSFCMKNISLHQMQALFDQDKIYGDYEVHSFIKEVVAAKTQAEGVTLKHPELTPLLERFESLFQALDFDSLKYQLSTVPILRLPDFNQMFVVEADASDNGIGALLLNNGQPISYFSRKLRPRMRIAATYQKALFAIVETVYKCRQYLVGRRFIICTDHKSIKEFMKQVIQTSIQQKYVRKLLGFNFEATGSYLQSLPTPTAVWEEVYMDIITGLPVYKGMTVILVVVDRFSKYAHLARRIIHRRMDKRWLVTRVWNNILGLWWRIDLNSRLAISLIPYLRGSSKVATVAELLVERDEEFQKGEPLEKSVAICDSRMVLRNGSLAQQVLVQCDGQSLEEAIQGPLPFV